MWITIGAGAAVLLVILLRPYCSHLFDPGSGSIHGVRVKVYHYLLMVLLDSISVTAKCRVSESILIVAMLITPLKHLLYQ